MLYYLTCWWLPCTTTTRLVRKIVVRFFALHPIKHHTPSLASHPVKHLGLEHWRTISRLRSHRLYSASDANHSPLRLTGSRIQVITTVFVREHSYRSMSTSRKRWPDRLCWPLTLPTHQPTIQAIRLNLKAFYCVIQRSKLGNFQKQKDLYLIPETNEMPFIPIKHWCYH